MTIAWPRNMLIPTTGGSPVYVPRTVSGPTSVSGFRQSVASDAGGWQVTLGGILIRTRADLLKWNELAVLLEGRLNPVLVPVFSRKPGPDPFFSDETGHDTDAPVEATVSGAAALRATTMAVNVAYGGALVPGMDFSIGERLYRVRSIVSVVGSVTTVTIRPGLRVALSGGETAEFNAPVVKCRLADDLMPIDLQSFKRASPSVTFIEDPT